MRRLPTFLCCARLVAITLLASVLPLGVGSLASQATAATPLPYGTSAYQAVSPFRLAETRASEGRQGYTQVGPSTIRVQVAGRGGVPANATAAVLNIVEVNPSRPGFVTAYPSGEAAPESSNINIDVPGRVIANLVTVKLGMGGSVDIFSSSPLDLAVDVSGAYLPTPVAVAAGRLVTVAAGALRVLDTRDTGGQLGPNSSVTVNLAAAAIPADASAVVINLTAVNAGPGFWTAYPAAQSRPLASNLNIDGPGQVRPAQAVVLLTAGQRSINVYASSGGDLIVDVAGWFTGAASAVGTDGLFVPSSPLRYFDTRQRTSLAPWAGSTFEFPVGNPFPAQAVALNVTATSPWTGGFVTGYPAGLARPNASNVNVSSFDQTIANHAIVRLSNRGVALYTSNGAHLIADVNGWYLGTPSVANQPVPVNPSYQPNPVVNVTYELLGISLPVATGPNLTALADSGYAATWSDLVNVAEPGNVMLFGHRTSHGGPFRPLNYAPIGSTFDLLGSDGHAYTYFVVRVDSTLPDYPTIANIAASMAPVTAQLVACDPPGSVSRRIVVTGRLISVA